MDISRTNDVIEKHKDIVYRIAISNVKTVGDAEDVFQEVFCAYFRSDKDTIQLFLQMEL